MSDRSRGWRSAHDTKSLQGLAQGAGAVTEEGGGRAGPQQWVLILQYYEKGERDGEKVKSPSTSGSPATRSASASATITARRAEATYKIKGFPQIWSPREGRSGPCRDQCHTARWRATNDQ